MQFWKFSWRARFIALVKEAKVELNKAMLKSDLSEEKQQRSTYAQIQRYDCYSQELFAIKTPSVPTPQRYQIVRRNSNF